MRGFFYILSTLGVVALAYWAYHQGYETRQTARDVQQLQSDIGKAHERLAVLRAEWAYLNRPDRLRELAEMNFERLQLMPLSADQFGKAAQVAYPPIAPPPETRMADSDGEGVLEGVDNIQRLQGADSRLIAPTRDAAQPELLP
jgi:hypothetical protein